MAVLTSGTSFFQGLYQFSVCEARGGAQALSQDELDCGTYIHDSSSYFIAPNFPLLTASITSTAASPLMPGQSVSVRVSTSGRALKIVALKGWGSFAYSQSRLISSQDSTQSLDFVVTIPSGATSGTETFQAQITDAMNQVVATAALSFAVASLPPIITNIQSSPASPEEGSSFAVSAIVTPGASGITISQVTFTFNGRSVVDPAAPYEASFTTPDVSGSTGMPVTVEALDSVGGRTTASSTVTVTPVTDGQAPQVAIQTNCLSPLYPQGYTLALPVTATDNLRLSRLDVLRDGAVVSTISDLASASFSQAVPVAFQAVGAQTYQIKIYDYAGGHADSAPFSIETTAPADG